MLFLQAWSAALHSHIHAVFQYSLLDLQTTYSRLDLHVRCRGTECALKISLKDPYFFRLSGLVFGLH